MIITFPSHICIETVHGLRQQVRVAALHRGLRHSEAVSESNSPDAGGGETATAEEPKRN